MTWHAELATIGAAMSTTRNPGGAAAPRPDLLSPCPFCSCEEDERAHAGAVGPALEVTDDGGAFFVWCRRCGARGPVSHALDPAAAKQSAGILWNRGVARTLDSRAEFGQLCEERAALETLVRSLLLVAAETRRASRGGRVEDLTAAAFARSSGAWWPNAIGTEAAAYTWLESKGLLR